jgi:hypothetical protein
MNVADFFFRGAHHPRSVQQMPLHVDAFVKAARASGFDEVTCFIDAAIISNEGMTKWKSRRIREV